MFFVSRADHLEASPAFRKPRICALVDAALMAALFCGAMVNLYFLSKLDLDIFAVFVAALLCSTMLSAIPACILWFFDSRERESLWLLSAAFLWGGTIATTLSMPLNGAFFRTVDQWIALNPTVKEVLGPNAVTLIAAPLCAPIVEEVIKAAGVLLIFWIRRGEFDGMRDGFVYGALVGVGFNWFEAPLYVMQEYATTEVAPYGHQLGSRYGLLGLGGHAMFTSIFGVLLGLAAQTSRRWVKWLAPISGLLFAMTAHFMQNSLPLLLAIAEATDGEAPAVIATPDDVGFLQAVLGASLVGLTLFFPFALALLIALWRSDVWERGVIRDELASEVGRSVTPTEYQGIISDRILRKRRIKEFHPQLSAALVNAQYELALRKRRVRNQGENPESDPRVAAWRRDIERVRAGLDSSQRELVNAGLA